MSRKRLFIENFLAYGAINALDKIVPIVMLPIVTRLITDSADYGKFEMFNTKSLSAPASPCSESTTPCSENTSNETTSSTKIS